MWEGGGRQRRKPGGSGGRRRPAAPVQQLLGGGRLSSEHRIAHEERMVETASLAQTDLAPSLGGGRAGACEEPTPAAARHPRHCAHWRSPVGPDARQRPGGLRDTAASSLRLRKGHCQKARDCKSRDHRSQSAHPSFRAPGSARRPAGGALGRRRPNGVALCTCLRWEFLASSGALTRWGSCMEGTSEPGELTPALVVHGRLAGVRQGQRGAAAAALFLPSSASPALTQTSQPQHFLEGVTRLAASAADSPASMHPTRNGATEPPTSCVASPGSAAPRLTAAAARGPGAAHCRAAAARHAYR